MSRSTAITLWFSAQCTSWPAHATAFYMVASSSASLALLALAACALLALALASPPSFGGGCRGGLPP